MKQPNLFPRILVAVDAAGLAAHAVEQALWLASRLGSEIELLHAVDVPPALWPGLDEADLARIHQTALTRVRQQVLSSLQGVVERMGPGEPIANLLQVVPGHAAKVILDKAVQGQSDLLVLGPHARRGLLDLGSTARAVLSRAATPVWVQVEPAAPLSSILVALDFSDHSRAALEAARELALALDAALHVIHCYEPPEFAYDTSGQHVPDLAYVVDQDRQTVERRFEQAVAELGSGAPQVTSEFVEGRPNECIVEAARSHDLIVMGTHGRTRFTRFLMGSVANAVLREAPQPVLVVPSADETWLQG